MEFDFLPYEDTYFKELVDLLNLSFGIKTKNKEELISWKLFNKIWGEPIIYLAKYQEKLVGVYTSIPHPISYKGKAISATACIDMATHPDFRRKGIIKKLAEKTYTEVRKQNFELSFGFSNEQGVKVDLNANNYGYHVLGKFQKYYKPVIRQKKCSLYLANPTPEIQNINVPDFNNPYLQIKKDHTYVSWR